MIQGAVTAEQDIHTRTPGSPRSPRAPGSPTPESPWRATGYRAYVRGISGDGVGVCVPDGDRQGDGGQLRWEGVMGSVEVGGVIGVAGGGRDDRYRRASNLVPPTLSPLGPEAPGTPCGQSKVRVLCPSKAHTHTQPHSVSQFPHGQTPTHSWDIGALLLTVDPGGPGGPKGPGGPSLPGRPARPYQNNEAKEEEGDLGTFLPPWPLQDWERPRQGLGPLLILIHSSTTRFKGPEVTKSCTCCSHHTYPLSTGAWLTHLSSRACLTRESNNTRSPGGSRGAHISLEHIAKGGMVPTGLPPRTSPRMPSSAQFQRLPCPLPTSGDGASTHLHTRKTSWPGGSLNPDSRVPLQGKKGSDQAQGVSGT